MNFLNVDIPVKNVPELDKGFVPLGLFFKHYEKGAAKPLCIAVERSGGQIGTWECKVHGTPDMAEADAYYVDRLVKFLLWSWGGFKVYICGDDKLADIDDDKCISCGACMKACPFGAISDRAQILNVINEFKAGRQVIAMFAPALEGEFGAGVPVAKLKKALEQLGFEKAYEVGLGADAVAMAEAEELLEHLKAGLKMTTSCCPAFVNMIRKHFPRLQANVSTTVSPMVALSRWVREKYPQAKVVFIGPCVAKKTEQVEGGPDYVLTTEEIVAMMDARKIDPDKMEADPVQESSTYGKGFASSGGVTSAVMQVIQEMGEVPQVSAQRCNGAAECKKALMMLQAGKFDMDFIEGMACEGGCMYGPGNLLNERLYTQARKKFLGEADDRGVIENAKEQGFDQIHMHR